MMSTDILNGCTWKMPFVWMKWQSKSWRYIREERCSWFMFEKYIIILIGIILKKASKVKRLVIQGEMGSVTLHLASRAQVEVVASSKRWRSWKGDWCNGGRMQKFSSKGFSFLREIRSLAAGSKSLRNARQRAWLNSEDKMHYDCGHKLDMVSQEFSKC